MITEHAQRRIEARLGEAGFTALQCDFAQKFLEEVAARLAPEKNVGVRFSLGKELGMKWEGLSGEDTLVAVIKEGAVVTIVLQRSCYPITKPVDKVYDLGNALVRSIWSQTLEQRDLTSRSTGTTVDVSRRFNRSL